jgi:hypothetical protein
MPEAGPPGECRHMQRAHPTLLPLPGQEPRQSLAVHTGLASVRPVPMR